MARIKGSPKTGGKKKGTPNKRTVVMRSVQELMAKHNIDPLDFAFRQMKIPLPTNRNFDQKMQVMDYRMRAAATTLPYTRPKLAQIENRGTGPGGSNINFNSNQHEITGPLDGNDPQVLEAARRVAFLLALGVRQQTKLEPAEKVVNPPKSGV